MIATFTVSGLPETKGSWRALPGGRMKRDNPRELAWSATVGWTAKVAMGGNGPCLGPVAVHLTFWLPQPRGRKNQRDIDKLARSCLDAMNKIVYVDDEQVVELHASKHVTPGVAPGVDIRVLESTIGRVVITR